MRLLNVYNLTFNKFDERDLPPYAIASHRWEESETTYREVNNRHNVNSKGFLKVQRFCQLLQRRNQRVKDLDIRRVEWLWIDTCCIDKDSSADVAESITYMYAGLHIICSF